MTLLRMTLLALTLAGCTKDNPTSCVDGYCSDPSLPFCDEDGSFSGTPKSCIAVECTPAEFAGCRGDQALICNAGGNDYEPALCELGCDDTTGCITQTLECEPGTSRCGDGTLERCNAAGEYESEACAAGCVEGAAPHCAYLDPAYLPNICDVPATAAHLDLGSASTDDDALCNGGIVEQTDGAADICVVRYQTITVPDGGAETAITGSRVLALVADSRVEIAGVLDISANGTTPGAGAGTFEQGGIAVDEGGGGGGGATPGAPGGSSAGTGGAANGGALFNPSPLVVLRGGARHITATSNGTFILYGETGGGPGGAMTAIACRGEVRVTGLIDAGGGGGHRGDTFTSYGAGGGSGGFVALQGLGVFITGRVYANGGGGGDGKPTMPSPAAPAKDGHDGFRASTIPPINRFLHDGGLGGYGGIASAAPMPGHAGTGARAAGGGGAMGALQTFTPEGVTPGISPIDSSPAFSTPRVVRTR